MDKASNSVYVKTASALIQIIIPTVLIEYNMITLLEYLNSKCRGATNPLCYAIISVMNLLETDLSYVTWSAKRGLIAFPNCHSQVLLNITPQVFNLSPAYYTKPYSAMLGV